MKDVYVAGCARTAIGSFGGSLKGVSAPRLGSIAIREALARAGVEARQVDEVFLGCVLAAGLGQNVARQSAMGADIPVEVPSTTINMVCGSGMKAVVEGIRAIRSGEADIIVAGGTENMSDSPYLVPGARWGARMFDTKLVDSMVYDGLWDAHNDYHMGMTAENICDQWRLTREELDTLALVSQQRAEAAREAGKFRDEIVPVPVKSKKDMAYFAIDEYIRDSTSSQSLAKLSPAFKPGSGLVTAGNSSGINDGAAALVIASGDAVKKYGLNPLARIAGWGQSGVDPSIMGIGPVKASEKALKQAGLAVEDIDLVEANEAFAAQSAAVIRDLGLDGSRVNVNGGAIALGHPIGASGARIIVTLLYEMRRQPKAKHGLATLCIGGGMGIATVFEKI